MRSKTPQREQGSIIVLILSLIIIVVLAATAFVVVMHAHKKANNTVTTPPAQSSEQQKDNSNASDSTTSLSELRIKSHNVTRRQDVAQLMAATEVFEANNRGNWPTGFSNGQLTGQQDDTPSPVSLQFYTNVTVLDGAQDPLRGDGLQLVVDATCSGNGGTVEGTASRSYAVLYAQQNNDGSYTPQCKPST